MHSATEVLAELIKSSGIGTPPADDAPWPVFIGQLPNEPNESIAIVDNAQQTNGRIHRTGETIAVAGYQVRVRADHYKEAQDKVFAIRDEFDRTIRKELPVGDKLYVIQGVHHDETPVFIGPDENVRMNFTINGSVSFREKQ